MLQRKAITPFITGLLVVTGFIAGCDVEPTFPSDQVVPSMVEICKELYDLDVEADANGGTLGIQYQMETILDEEGKTLPKEIHKLLGNLTLAVTRVALSTNRDVDFVVVSVVGVKEQMELKLIRNLIDVKRAQTEALSTTESMSRTLFTQTRFDTEKNEGKPYEVAEMFIEEFLAKQILQRVRYKNPPEDPTSTPKELFDGRFISTPKGRFFEMSVLTLDKERTEENIKNLIQISAKTLGGYEYRNYDQVIIRDLLEGTRVDLDKKVIADLYNKDILPKDVLLERKVKDTNRAKVFKNALQIFGLDLSSQDSSQDAIQTPEE